MRQKSMSKNDPAERTVGAIRRKTRKQYAAEEKIRIVVPGLRGEESIAALCRRAGIAEGLYYSGSKEFLEAGKKRLAGDTGGDRRKFLLQRVEGVPWKSARNGWPTFTRLLTGQRITLQNELFLPCSRVVWPHKRRVLRMPRNPQSPMPDSNTP